MGSVSTAILAGKASFTAAELIRQNDPIYDHHSPRDAFDLKDKAALTWKLYLPAAGTLVLTISSVIFAQQIGTRRAATMAAAYGLSEKMFSEYKDKVVETLGKNKEQTVRDEVAQDRVTKNPPSDSQIVLTEGGTVLCKDEHSGRYFQSSVEAMRAAQNAVNYQINSSFYASLNDFYDSLGLERTKLGDEIGWNADRQLELEISTAKTPDDRPCLVLDFQADPIRGYARVM